MVLLACLGPGFSLESPVSTGSRGVSLFQLGQDRHSPQDPVLAVVISHDLGRRGKEKRIPVLCAR